MKIIFMYIYIEIQFNQFYQNQRGTVLTNGEKKH